MSHEMTPAPFVVLFMERSGSSYLCSLLNSHPDILCRYEDFATVGPEHRDRQLMSLSGELIDDPHNKEVIDHLLRIYYRPRQAAGFKLKFPYQYNAFPELLTVLLEHKSKLRVILLDRADTVRRMVSLYHFHELRLRTSLKSGNVVDSVPVEKFRIDVPLFVHHVRLEAHHRTTLLSVAGQFPNLLKIDYHDLHQTPATQLDRIAGFLDVPAFVNPATPFRKATPHNLADIIENHDELQTALANLQAA